MIKETSKVFQPKFNPFYSDYINEYALEWGVKPATAVRLLCVVGIKAIEKKKESEKKSQ